MGDALSSPRREIIDLTQREIIDLTQSDSAEEERKAERKTTGGGRRTEEKQWSRMQKLSRRLFEALFTLAEANTPAETQAGVDAVEAIFRKMNRIIDVMVEERVQLRLASMANEHHLSHE